MLTNLDDDYEQSAHGVLRPRAEITMVAVIKKNTAPMRKLLKSIKETSPNSLKSTPLLLIDDECDQASVNTRDRDEDPAAINGLIRNLLETVPHSHYIGYTATPFANVLINPEISTDREADLYPRDFILSYGNQVAIYALDFPALVLKCFTTISTSSILKFKLLVKLYSIVF